MPPQLFTVQGLFQEFLINQLRPSNALLRATYDVQSISQLAASIIEKGLLQPIVVRSQNDDHYFEIIAGHRRFEACKMLGWSKIMCHIVEVDDKEAYEISLLENLQQKSLNPIEEAKAFKKYVTTFGWDGESDLAQRIGKNQEYISRRIRLLNLPQDLQSEIMRHRINVSAAQELLPLDDSDAIQDLNQYIKQNKPNVREIRQIVRIVKDKPKQFDNFITLCQKSMDKDPTEDILKLSKSIFRKSILSLRIAIKSIDIMLDELNDDHEQNKNDHYHRRSNTVDEVRWVLVETLMQHRLRLHDQIDTLLKQQRKIVNTV